MPVNYTFPLDFPTWRGVRAVEQRAQRSVGLARSPFSFARYKQDRGGKLWRFNVTVPLLDRDTALNWEAWFLALNGREGSFLFGDPSATNPRGSWAGTPVVNGAGQTGSTLQLRNFTPSAAGVVRPGDYFQLGNGASSRLYRVPGVTAYDADAGGLVTIDIWPALRGPSVNADPVRTVTPQGVFELDSNDTPMAIDEALRSQQFTFPIVEAL